MSPADTFHTTTRLIETAARIIAVDAQLLPAYADEAVAYARGLGKPLDRLIVTHAHPDHYNGAARFGVPVHALAQVREQIIARGDTRLPDGTVVPLSDFTPTVDRRSDSQTEGYGYRSDFRAHRPRSGDRTRVGA
jgi:glyoxylase-like metal-dependent hydrolase (beta-lactamase superfamily II)